jgi:hypothetical protein
VIIANSLSYNCFTICGDTQKFKALSRCQNTEHKLIAREHKLIANVIIAGENCLPGTLASAKLVAGAIETGETFCADFLYD